MQPGVEHREDPLRPDRPEAARGREPVAALGTLLAGCRRETEHREVGRACHADAGVGRGDAPLGRRDVRAALEQLRGQARDRRRGMHEIGPRAGAPRGETDSRGTPTSTAIACSVWARRSRVSSRLGARGLELRLRLLHVRERRGTALVEIARELERPGVIGHGVVEELLLRVEAAQREVIRGELGVHAQVERLRDRRRSPARSRARRRPCCGCARRGRSRRRGRPRARRCCRPGWRRRRSPACWSRAR